MTITKNTDCTEIYITQSLFAGYENSTNDVTAVTLYYTVNDGDEQSFEVADTDIVDGILTLDIEFFGQSGEALLDGIYCFRLFIEENDGDTETTEYGNILVDCSLLCTLAEYTWNNPEKMLYAKYEAIKYYQQCNSCDCSTVYSLYTDLMSDLDITLNHDCGC